MIDKQRLERWRLLSFRVLTVLAVCFAAYAVVDAYQHNTGGLVVDVAIVTFYLWAARWKARHE